MLPQPVPKTSPPAYPTRREFLAKGTMLFLAANCGGCGQASAHPVVAPIFEHGEGRGADGCVVTNPPVFLSEDEAMQVIKEELEKAGIRLGEKMPLPEVATQDFYSQPKKWLGDPRLNDLNHLIDRHAVLGAVDQEHKVGVEFISSEDSWRNFMDLADTGTVGHYPTKKCAHRLADAIAEKGTVDLRIGIFYDPLTKLDFDGSDDGDKEGEADDYVPDANASKKDKPKKGILDLFRMSWQRKEEAAKKKSKALLRRQAQDFVAWLKTQ